MGRLGPMYNFLQFFNTENYFFNPYAIPNLVVTTFLLALGIFVFLQNKKSMVNLSFLVLHLSASLWLFGLAMCYFSKNEAIALFWVNIDHTGLVFISTSIYAFSVAYLKLKHQKKILIAGYLLSCIFLILSWTKYFSTGVAKHFWGYYYKANFLYSIFVLFFGVFMLLSLYNFYKQYKKETQAIEKERRKYIFIAYLIAYLGSVDYLAAYGREVYPFGYIPVTACLSILAYTIVKYRLMDIETIIHRTITYASLSFLILLPYAAILTLTQVLLRGTIDVQEILTTGFFILLLLFLISPLKNKTQAFVDRLFYKDKYDYRKTLESFAKKLSLFLDSPNLLPTIIETIAQTMHIGNVSLLLLDDKSGRYQVKESKGLVASDIILSRESPFIEYLQSYGGIVERELLIMDPNFEQVKAEGLKLLNNLGAELVIPLIIEKRVIGILGLGKKLSREVYKIEDINLLSTIGQEIAVAINNRLLFEGLEIANAELKEAQIKLIQSAKMAAVGQLGAGVAHELNNPLGGILGYAQFVLEKIKRPEFGAEDFQGCSKYLESIEREAARCKGIVENLLKFSRRPIVAKPEALDIAAALADTLSIIGHQLKLKNIKLTLDIKPDLFRVIGIINQLQQVFTNLILNAQQAMPESGELKITAYNILDEKTKTPIHVRIEFSDTGCGIAEESLAHMFEPFFTTKLKEKGTGLGLAVSYQIIQDHKGTIEVTSQVGKGTTIRITLPVSGRV
jgi:signal transduction histidine kinase